MERDEPGVGPARVTFTEFVAPDAPMLLAWSRFRRSLIGAQAGVKAGAPVGAAPVGAPAAAAPAGAGGASGLWRLLATNNRELGRSFLLYRRFDAARAHVEQLQARVDALTIEHIPGPIKGSRGWVIVAGDAPVMTCSRWYSSLSAGSVAASRALEAFGTAVLAEAADRSDASGRFRRRVPKVADAQP